MSDDNIEKDAKKRLKKPPKGVLTRYYFVSVVLERDNIFLMIMVHNNKLTDPQLL